MAAWPPHSPHLLPAFRAPPPSPAADGGDEPTADDELTEFLSHSLRVPELVLPDRIFPQEATVISPPVIDMASFISPEDRVLAANIMKTGAASIGCFQIVNHGISNDLIEPAKAVAAALFRLSPDIKKAVGKSLERRWGFEVEEEGEETEGEESFWWCGRREQELAGIWPHGFKEPSDKLQRLCEEMEKIASKIGEVILEKGACNYGMMRVSGSGEGSALCLHKHSWSSMESDGPKDRLRHEVLRMLIRSSSSSSALTLHIGGGPSAFHVYSKKGWLTFRPNDGAIVATIGDQIQAWTGGLYKCVTGKFVFYEAGKTEGPISIAFICSHPSLATTPSRTAVGREKTISLVQQLMLAVCLTLIYAIIVCMYRKV